MGTYWKNYVAEKRKKVVAAYNKLLKGNVSVAQAHAERDEIYAIFNQLADELQQANDERNKASMELKKLQWEIKKRTNN